MLRIGLTGGIGAGKSTVARRLLACGAVVIDADQLARAVVARGTDGLAQIVSTFGDQVLTTAGDLDRPALGRLVFTDPGARAQLNAITHPRIAALTAQAMADVAPDAVVVHDVPLLVENRMQDRYHLVVVVHATADERIARLVQQRGMVAQDAAARVEAQADDEARRAAADVWLDNVGAPDELLAQIDDLWSNRLVPFATNLRTGRCGPRSPGTVAAAQDDAWFERVRLRIVRATGLAAEALRASRSPQSPVLDEIVLAVRDRDHAASLQPALLDAGYPPQDGVLGHAIVHCSADPAVRLSVRLAWADDVADPTADQEESQPTE